MKRRVLIAILAAIVAITTAATAYAMPRPGHIMVPLDGQGDSPEVP